MAENKQTPAKIIDIFKSLDTDEPEMSADEYTLMSALERIVVVSHKCGLETAELKKAEIALQYVCDRTGMNEIQAMLFAICVDHSFDHSIQIIKIRRWVECPMISLIKQQVDLDNLVKQGFLMPGRRNVDDYGDEDIKTYAVPSYVLDGLENDEVVTKSKTAGLSVDAFFDTMGQYYRTHRNGWGFSDLQDHLYDLFEDNPQLGYCQQFKEIGRVCDVAMVALNYCCCRLVNHGDSVFTEEKIRDVFPSRKECADFFRSIMSEENEFCELGLVELVMSDGMAGEEAFTLSNKARQTLLAEANVDLLDEAHVVRGRELVAYDKIKSKQMFYSQSVEGQISRLSTLLGEESFANVCKRLEENGLRRGFACLFYGAPGTGKTETVLQLARMNGRDIMQVDISEMRSKWVGESQKMVKAMFDRYRRAVKRSKVAPILLFNEADAILTRRKADTDSSVDKMENAMQNIFLQEIENLEGILIATTNLTDSLDPAFERRFLYKVKFDQPDTQCRAKIWRALVDDISEDEAKTLAEHYDFSGGQIENISRKQVVDSILYGDTHDRMSRLRSYCESELIEGSYQAKRVGFIA